MAENKESPCCKESILIWIIENLVLQACERKDDGLLDSFGITAYAEAMEILGEYGRIEIVSACGRRVIARLPKKVA
jgi:hypothetical protein